MRIGMMERFIIRVGDDSSSEEGSSSVEDPISAEDSISSEDINQHDRIHLLIFSFFGTVILRTIM